jgi:hypothetical protein
LADATAARIKTRRIGKMNILEKIDQALTGRPQKPKNPIEVAAETICELSVPRIKSAMGSRYAEAKTIFADIMRLQKLLNFELGEADASEAFRKQQDEHSEIATAGGDLPGVARGRSREAWIADFAARKEAAEQAAIKAAKKYQPLKIELGDLILAELRDQIGEIENTEARLAAKFGLPYKSSATVSTLRQLPDYLRNIGTDHVLKNF